MSAKILLTYPTNGKQNIPLIRQDYLELVAQRGEYYEQSDYDINNMDRLCFPEPVILKWQGGSAPFQVKLYQSDLKVPQIFHTDSHEFAVWNLQSHTVYRWSVSDQQGITSAEFSFTTAKSPRLIMFPERECGPINFRDAGGYSSFFGGRVKQGMVYRGSDYNMFVQTCEENKDFMLNVLNIRTELDLRYPQDTVNRTSSDLGSTVQWIHRPVNAYHSFIPEQNILFRDTMRVFADPAIYPVFVHCNGGCDRTGEIIFLLNALLGVSDEDLLQDYELTSLSLFSRKRNIAYFAEWRNTIAGFADPDSPYRVSVEAYLRHLGITDEEIRMIRLNLLEK